MMRLHVNNKKLIAKVNWEKEEMLAMKNELEERINVLLQKNQNLLTMNEEIKIKLQQEIVNVDVTTEIIQNEIDTLTERSRVLRESNEELKL